MAGAARVRAAALSHARRRWRQRRAAGQPQRLAQNARTCSLTAASFTATGGYEQLYDFLNIPNDCFELQMPGAYPDTSTTQTYTNPSTCDCDPAPYLNDHLYANACFWNNKTSDSEYRTCVDTQPGPGVSGQRDFCPGEDKAGGDPVIVTDLMPTGLTLQLPPVAPGWTCSASTAMQLSCTFNGFLGPGVTAPTIQATFTVAANAAPVLLNTAQTMSGTSDPIFASDNAICRREPVPAPALSPLGVALALLALSGVAGTTLLCCRRRAETERLPT